MREIHFVENRCLGCEECVEACSKAHGGEARSFVVVVDGYFPFPLSCRHCEDAPCRSVCPSDAIQRNEFGALVLNQERCIGCHSCVQICPFGALATSPINGAVLKCDLCPDLQAEGLDPACVASCPKGAIEFTLPDPPLAARRQRVAGFVKASIGF